MKKTRRDLVNSSSEMPSPVARRSPVTKLKNQRNLTPVHLKPETPKEKFDFWIPDQILNIENLLVSKQRTLDLLNSKTEDLDKDLELQIQARDKHINELNKTILALKTSLKVSDEKRKQAKEHAIEAERLEEELQAEKILKLNEEKKYFDLKLEFDKSKEEWKDEKESLQLLQEAVTEELEASRAQVASKQNEVNAIKSDIIQISKIIDQMTTLNKDLHDKIDKIHADMEETTKRYYEAKVKADNVEDFENTIAQYMSEQTRLQKSNAKLLTQQEDMKNYLKVVEDVKEKIKEAEEGIGAQVKRLDVEKPEDDELLIFLRNIEKELNETKSMLIKHTPKSFSVNDTEESVRERVVHLEEQLKIMNDNMKTALTSQNPLLNQIEGLENTMKKMRAEYEDNANKIRKHADIMKEQNDAFRDKLDVARQENEKKEAELQKTLTKLANINNRVDTLIKRGKEQIAKEEELRRETSLWKAKYSSVVMEKKSNGVNNQRENKIKKALFQLQTLREEIYKKDTEVIAKHKEIAKLESELQTKNDSLQKAYSKMKTIEGDILSKVSKDLDEKDRQIILLKEMLRGANTEARSKKKSESYTIHNTEPSKRQL
ncbi:unnamed protein product [Blepharisma stoltei]|uniref:Uncharacterized protein n=1 Tax=Blepharisma stoltei TaxID=1481888 RepID=A0AAU9IGE8_9CILI|nr:unnamed protein product [Blepharisma stoltei]